MTNFNTEQLERLMRSFYLISGIRFVLYDSEFKEIMSFPKNDCEFCSLMKSNCNTRRKCAYADKRSFNKCRESGRLYIYKCHAGLVEAVMPLYENEKNIGYLMLGQISDNKNNNTLIEKITYWQEKYGFDTETLNTSIQSITYKSTEEIYAAAKIMEACTCYIAFKELIEPEESRVFKAAKAYIDKNLSADLDIADICKELSLGRTKLYDIFKREANIGVSEYINRRRLHKAKSLLKTTDMSIPEIASAAGFNDYNYFSRVYKKRYGKAPKFYRKK